MSALEDWRLVLDSLEKLEENEEKEKPKYVFGILYTLVKFVIELMENGLDIPNKLIEKLKENENSEAEENIEVKLAREEDVTFYT